MLNRFLGRDPPVVVIDNGSGTIKAGYAGVDSPKAVFQASIGRPLDGNSDELIGEDYVKKLSSIKYPVQHGQITDWDEAQMLWAHAYSQLPNAHCRKNPLLITEAPLNPKKNREKMCEYLFESFSVPSLFIHNKSVLSLYAAGQTSGIVAHSGAGVTYASAIWEGFLNTSATTRYDFGGRDIDEAFVEEMARLKLSDKHGKEPKLAPWPELFRTTMGREVCRDMREKMGYLAIDFEKEVVRCQRNLDADTNLNQFQLPDGRFIRPGTHVFAGPESLFDPSRLNFSYEGQPELISYEWMGLDAMVAHAISKCEIDSRRRMMSAIVLSGGNTLYENMEFRMNNSLDEKVPGDNKKISVIAQPGRRYGVWVGASVLASLSLFKKMLVTKKEYDETGVAIVHERFF